jgi:hypothetical protein
VGEKNELDKPSMLGFPKGENVDHSEYCLTGENTLRADSFDPGRGLAQLFTFYIAFLHSVSIKLVIGIGSS